MSETIILPPGGGRSYAIGAMTGVFKADEEEYCASEWSVEPGGAGRDPRLREPGRRAGDGVQRLHARPALRGRLRGVG
jgi:hypothetical protein